MVLCYVARQTRILGVALCENVFRFFSFVFVLYLSVCVM